MSEEWRPVVGYEGIFEVSSYGKVRSLDRLIYHKTYYSVKGKKVENKSNKKKGKVLSLTVHNGYVIAPVGKNKTAVHRLVAKAFIPNPENKPCVNHINGIKTDNRVENLEWCTPAENQQHALNTGLKDRSNNGTHHGSYNVKAKLTEDLIPLIRKEILAKPDNTGITKWCKILAEQYNVSETTIWNIRQKRNWNHV